MPTEYLDRVALSGPLATWTKSDAFTGDDGFTHDSMSAIGPLPLVLSDTRSRRRSLAARMRPQPLITYSDA